MNKDCLNHPERDPQEPKRRSTPRVASRHGADGEQRGPNYVSAPEDHESGFEAGLHRLQCSQEAQKSCNFRSGTASVDGAGSVGSISLPPPEVGDQSYHDNADTGTDQDSALTPLASQWTDAESMKSPVPVPAAPSRSSSHQTQSRRQRWTAAQPLQPINLSGLGPLHPMYSPPHSSIMSPSLHQLSPPLHDGLRWPDTRDDGSRMDDQGCSGAMSPGNEWAKQLGPYWKPPYHQGSSADLEASAGRGTHGSMDRQSSSSMLSLFPTASHTAPPRAEAVKSTTGHATSTKKKGGSAPAPTPIQPHWHSKLIQDQPDSSKAIGKADTSTHTTPYTAPHRAAAPNQPFSLRTSSQGGSWSRSWSASDSPMHLLSPRYRLGMTSSSVSIEEVLASTAAQQPLRFPATIGQNLPRLTARKSSSATHRKLPPTASTEPSLGALLASASLPTAWRCSRHISDWAIHHLTDSISLNKLEERMESADIRDCVWKYFHDSVHAEAYRRLQHLPGRPMSIPDLQQCRAIAKGGFGTIFGTYCLFLERHTACPYAVCRMPYVLTRVRYAISSGHGWPFDCAWCALLLLRHQTVFTVPRAFTMPSSA